MHKAGRLHALILACKTRVVSWVSLLKLFHYEGIACCIRQLTIMTPVPKCLDRKRTL